ncbi:hypothetical protein EKK58_04305 [Candidatus Dependentiae bacterium]|nr:MAG: hypothetical protein EKK58_04305 [Candidatus Dependentiae bacterium]
MDNKTQEQYEENRLNFRLAVSVMNQLGGKTGLYPFNVEGYFEDDNIKHVFNYINNNDKEINGEKYEINVTDDEHILYIGKTLMKKTKENFKFKVTKLDLYSYINGKGILIESKTE